MKKNLIKASIILSMLLLTLIPLSVSAISGNGTEESPFMITNEAELELVTDFPDCHFKLANDIVMTKELNKPLCYESEKQKFSGVLDGNGYTISNLTIDKVNSVDSDLYGDYGALFLYNYGTIKNLNIETSSIGITGYLASMIFSNRGIVSNCSISGTLQGHCVSGFTITNHGMIEKCKTTAELKGDIISGIASQNEDSALISQCEVNGCFSSTDTNNLISGICWFNDAIIENCYFIGSLHSDTAAGISLRNRNTIKNSYVVAILNDAESIYPIAYTEEGSEGIIENCYYDKTVSGRNSTTYGTPKSTTAMKMKQTYQNWDFDTVWGIDENINNGYPYLLWEHPDVEAKNPYTVNDVKIKDLSGNELKKIPDSSFYFEINVIKNGNSKNADSLIIAIYDENGAFVDLKYMSGIYYQNQTMSFGTMINKTDKKIGKIKAFVWNNISGMHPLSNSMEITK